MENKLSKKTSIFLIIYDLIVALSVCFFILYVYLYKNGIVFFYPMINHTLLFIVDLYVCRYFNKIYKQIWRYGGVQCYLKLIFSDCLSMFIFYVFERIVDMRELSVPNTISIFTIDLLVILTMRIAYRYCYKFGNTDTKQGRVLNKLLNIFSLGRVKAINSNISSKIPVAILGAGRIGVGLAEELLNNANSNYVPRLFLESDKEKIGREILDLDIMSEDISKEIFDEHDIKEVIFTVHNMDLEKRQELYNLYKGYGLKVKVYDFPLMQADGNKRQLREFDIEELLYRKEVLVLDDKTKNYYRNKVVLITGGGGSIGSEMARQIAKMNPKQIVLLDIYENGVYDIQMEMRLLYKGKLNLSVEICNICDKASLDKVFKQYKPNIVIHAAAHKHVPLMENNVCEAISNNVFGTLNTVEVSKKYKVKRFIMVSTDKAVNPTNVMGATKRMCEMIVKCNSSLKSDTTFSMTRFGNVLGSAGSVIPLFKRQIAQGGPVTITDYRIIRYFMTIPEASQLVLKSGAMAKNGELFVLDMAKPVKILDLAENMIRLSGLEPYKDIDIVETGLRPGEKLYEELLVKSETLSKTSDKLIFIEDDKPITKKQLEEKLEMLRNVVEKGNDLKAKEVLKKVVPTFLDPSVINDKGVKTNG